MALTDRDTKIILLLLVIAVIALPYVFYTKDTREDTETQKAQNETLRARLEHLQEMNKNRDFYIAETERMQKERDDLIASFPANIYQENYTMWLLYMETNSMQNALDQYDEYDEYKSELREKFEADPDYELSENEVVYSRLGYDGIDGNTVVLFTDIAYGGNDEIEISDPEVIDEEKLTGLINDSTLSFSCYYDGLKYLLDYISNFEDPMVYKTIALSFTPSSGEVDGNMVLEQYAIAGRGRTLDRADAWPDLEENDILGVWPDGIFGARSELYNRQLEELNFRLLAKQLEDEANKEEAEEEDDDKANKDNEKKDEKK